MEPIVRSIFLTAAIGTGYLLVLAGERLIWSKFKLPWGVIWAASSTLYITGPAIIDTHSGISIFADINILHEHIIRSKTYSSGLITLGFGMGFLLTAIIRKFLKNTAPCPIKLEYSNSVEEFTGSKYFMLYCGLACISAFAFSHLVDGFDRYNSGATGAPLALFLSSLKIDSLTLYGFFYGLCGYVSKMTSNAGFKRTLKLRDPYFTAICIEAATIAFLVLKTGSRSMLAGCLITACIRYVSIRKLSIRSIMTVLLAAAVLLPISVNLFETIRIARSQSDFYRANPIHMARRLASSAVVWPSMTSVIVNNRREEFNDIAFMPSATCKELLQVAKTDLNKPQITRVAKCASPALDSYKESNPILANLYLSKFIGIVDGGSPASTHDWQSRFKEILGRAHDSTSKGESINLSGDLFLRGNLGFTLLGGLFLGSSYCCLSLVMGLMTKKTTNPMTQALLYLIPLGLTGGSLFLPIDGQLWLLTTQLPKTIVICFLLGASAKYFRKILGRLPSQIGSSD